MYIIRRAFRVALLLMIATVGALAQQKPIIVSVTVLPPYASALSEWDRHPERIIVTLTNTDGLRSYDVRLSGYLEDLAGGIKVETKDDYPVSPITVGAGSVRRLDGSELKLFNASAVTVTGSDKSLIARTGQLAEGTYSICIRALDHGTKEVLSPNPGCATFTIRALEAPIPVGPPCDMKITQTMNPQLVLFQWSPPAGAPPSITYTMSLAEVIPADRNAEEALNTATPPTLYTRELTTSMFQYGAADPELKKGSRYAWRVRAADPAGVVTFRDDGRSRVCTFIYGDDPMKDTTKKDTTKKETKDTTKKEDCTLPAYITGTFPSDNQRLPFRYFPVSVQFDPYCRNYTKFVSTYTLKNGMGGVVTSTPKTIEWKNGPFDNPTRQPDMFEQEESKNIIVNNDQNKDEKERKAQFLSPDTYYTWTADVTLTKKVYKGSDSSYEDTKKTVKGRFSVGMGTSELIEPENGKDMPPGTIELKWNTAQPPSGNSLALPFDLRLGNKGGGAKFYAMTVNEKWVLLVSRTPDMKKVVYTTSGRVGAGVNPLDPAQGEQFVKNSLYKTVNALPELKDEGEYFWMLKWLVDPDGADDGAYYNASEIRKFVISRNASCFTMSADSPADGSRIAHTKPIFTLRSSTALKAAELVDGNLRMWRAGTAGDTSAANLVMDITVSRRKTDAGSYVFAYPDGMPWLALNGDLIEMPVNRPGGMERALKDAVAGEKFLWQFTLRHGAMIRDDGRFCVRTVSASPLFSFVYGDTCLSAINHAPADGEVVGDSTGELMVKLSKPIRIANTFRREWFLYELKKGETAKTAALEDGRKRLTVELTTDDVIDPKVTNSLVGLKMAKLVEELGRKGESLKMGTRYAWKFRLTYGGRDIFADGGSCGGDNAVIETAPTSFIYGGCLTLKHLTPADGELINDATGDFMVEASKPVRIANTSRREWLIYELKKGEDPRTVDPTDGRKVHTVDALTDEVYDPSYTAPKFAVNMIKVAKELAKKGESLKVGTRYAWKFRLSYGGKDIFADGGSCGGENAVIESTPTSFIYGGCLTVKHLAPAEGQTINDAAGDFMVEMSKPIRIANTSRREWFIYELKKDEDLKKIDLEDGRKRLAVDALTDDVYDPDYTAPKFAVGMAKMAKELAKKGEALKIGQRYAWKFRLSYSGKGVFADGSSCGGDNATIESQPTTFVYGGACVNAANVSPLEGDTIVDATGDFRVKLSVRVKTATFGDREIELCELKKGEDPAKVDFRDGRERIVVKFERKHDKNDPELSSLFAIYLSKLIEKLPAGTALKPGTRYAWKMRAFYHDEIILEGGAACGRDTNMIESAPTSFVYGGCRFMKGTSPAERANLTTLPEFSFKVQPGVQEKQFGIVVLKIWKKGPGMSAEEAAKGKPVFDDMFTIKANLGTRAEDKEAEVLVTMADEFVASPRAVVDKLVTDWDLLQNADSSRFKPEEGGEYVWQAKADVLYKTENDKCMGDFLTPLHSFSYRKAGVDTTCLRIIAGWPDDGSVYDRPEDPQFSVIVKPGVKAAGIKGGRLQIWKKLPTETIDSAVVGKPVFDQTFEGSGDANLEIEADKPDATALKLKFVNHPNAKHTFKPEFGAAYVWRFTMAINGATVMADGTECSQSEIKSVNASFDYMGGGRTDCGNGEGCEAPEISDKNPSPSSNFSGQDIKAGFFRVRVTESTGNGGSLSGKGTINLPDMKAPVKVVFSNIKVNKSNVMYEGTIKGEVEEAQGIISKVAAKASRQLDLSPSDAEAIDNLLQQGKRLVSAMVSSKPIGLPIGIDAVISSKTYTLGILDISLTPKRATFAAGLRIETPDLASGQSTSFINFGARDVCITPTSFGSNGTAKLYVAGDFTTNLGGGMQLKIVAPKATELDDDSKGTYVRIKCGKFDGLRIEAAAVFPREWLVPANKDGSPNTDATKKVEARFVAQVKDWNNWLAKAELDKCLIAGDNGLGLEVKEMVYDHSDVANPDGITFPQGYGKGTDNTWRGFFIKRAAIALPASLSAYTADGGGKLPITFAADNLIVDKTGLSANFKVQNIVSTGVIAGWGFSLDEIGVEVVSSSLRKGYMNGAIKLPISEDKLGYECMIRDGRSNGGAAGLEWQFQIKPKNGDYNAKFWYAKLRLDASSNITIGNIPKDPKTGRKVNARAELTGDLSVDYDQSKLKLPQLKFEQFLLQSTPPQGEKRISCKKWSFTSPAKSMGGFPLMIEGIEPAVTEENDVTKVGLKFTIKLALAGDQTSIAGSAGLMIKAKLNMEAEELGEKLEFDGIDLTKISVNADMGAVKIKGQIDFYKQDQTFGDGFRGIVEAWFLKTVYVNITVQFGSRPSVKNPGENFRYWYVDALARFNPGIVLGPAIGIYGFGGGAWYHMAPKNQLNPALLMQQPENSDAAKDGQKAAAVSSKIGATLSGEEYVPSEETLFGFKASVTLGTVPDPKPLNADVQLQISFTSSGGLERIRFDGSVYMACDIIERKDPALKATASILYDNVNSIFHAEFQVNLNFKVVKAYIPAVIHVEPKWWQLKLGEPKNRMTLELDLAIIKLKFKSYLMAGDSLPPLPDPPDEVMSKLTAEQKAKIEKRAMIKNSASGFMFGTVLQIGPVEGSFLIFYGRLDLGVGFDVEVKKFENLYCGNSEGTGQVGFNGGWYAQGNAYAWIDAEIGLKITLFGSERRFKILALSGAALMRMGFPNPTWFEGYLAAKYSILGGLISGSCNYEFSIGEPCRPRRGSPFDDQVAMIEDITPKDGSRDIPVLVTPEISYNFEIARQFELQDLNDEKKVHTYRVRAERPLMYDAGGNIFQSNWSDAYLSKTSQISPIQMLGGFQRYRIDAAAYAEEYLNGRWDRATYPNPNNPNQLDPIRQTKTISFTTGPQPDYIPWENVTYSSPGVRQRFYLTDHPGTYTEKQGTVVLLRDQGYLLTPKEDQYVIQKLRVRLVSAGGKDTLEKDLKYYPAYDRFPAALQFDVFDLKQSTLYHMDIFRETRYKPGVSGSPASGLFEKEEVKEFSQTVEETSVGEGGATRTVSGTYEKKLQKLGQTRVNPLTKAQEKLLWANDFATSAYQNLYTKLMGLTLKRVDRKPDGRLIIHYDAFEPFDRHDLTTLSAQGNPPASWQSSFYNPQISNRIFSNIRAYTGEGRYDIIYYWEDGRTVDRNLTRNLAQTYTYGDLRPYSYQIPTQQAFIDRGCVVDLLTDAEINSGVINRYPRNRWSYGNSGADFYTAEPHDGPPGNIWFQYTVERDAWNVASWLQGRAQEAYWRGYSGEWAQYPYKGGLTWLRWQTYFWYMDWSMNNDRTVLSRFQALPGGWYELKLFETRGDNFEAPNPRYSIWFPYTWQPRPPKRGAGYF